jgi:hypothetical protein
MTMQRGLLLAYGFLLQLYPRAFRRRFGDEMLEVAEAAEPGEWALIFGDTSVAILRCWWEGSPSTAAVADPDAYLAIGESRASPSRLLPGLAISVVIIVGMVYAGYRWPPPCQGSSTVLTRIVDPIPASMPDSGQVAHERVHKAVESK